MQEIDDKIIERLQKLFTLSQRGVGGEATNASTILNRLLKKYNLSLESLCQSEKKRYSFSFKSSFEQSIFFSIVSQVLKVSSVPYFTKHGSKKINLDLTPYQYAEIQIQFDGYSKSWRNYLKKSQSAFYHANRLFYYSEKSTDEPKEKKPLTPEERAELMQIATMMLGVNKPVFKRNALEVKDGQ